MNLIRKYGWLINAIVWTAATTVNVLSGEYLAAWNAGCCVWFCLLLHGKDNY